MRPRHRLWVCATGIAVVLTALGAPDARASHVLQLSVQHINAADYPAQPDQGAIASWMSLKYLGNGSDSHISTPSASAIQNIYDFGKALQPAGAFNEYTLRGIMNHFESHSNYTYGVIHGADSDDVVGRIAYWMNRVIPDVSPYPTHAPVLIPFSGRYEHWVVVTGTEADADPYEYPDTAIHGLWIDDPAIYNDPFMPVQTNVFYSTEEGVMNNLDDFFLPILSGAHAGQFIAVVPVPIPEPSSLLLWSMGAFGLGLYGWWRRRR